MFSQILNYKNCLYNFVSLHKKYQSVYKTLRFISEKKDPHVFSQILNYKTCLYNFVSLHKKYQSVYKVFTKHYDSYLKKDPHVFSQILNYKTCLYNFVSLHKKYQSVYKKLRFISEKKILMCSHKYLTIKPVYTTLCLYTKNTKVFTKHYDSYPSNYKNLFIQLCVFTQKIPKCLQKHYDSYLKKRSSCVLTNT